MKVNTALRGEKGWSKKQCLLVIWKMLYSMRIGIVILFLIAMSAMIGIAYESIYTSKFFHMLEGLLCLNVTFCSIQRFTRLWNETFKQGSDLPLNIENLAVGSNVHLPLEKATCIVEKFICSMGYRVSRYSIKSGLIIYGVRGRFVPWGTFFVHISILLIVSGALLGGLYGFNTEITLPVGNIYTAMRGEKDSFNIRLNSFNTEYYQDGSVSDWISNITIENSGQQVLTREIKVNDPVNYNGVKIYQQAYDTALKTQVFDADGQFLKESVLIESEKMAMDENSRIVVQPVRYIPDFDAVRPMVSRSAEANNPYVLYIVYGDDREISWGAVPVGEPLKLGSSGSICFKDKVPVSILKLKHDPGLPLVLLGFIFMAGGFFISLYISYKRLWFVITDDCGKCTIKIFVLKAGEQEKSEITNRFADTLSVDAKNTVRGI